MARPKKSVSASNIKKKQINKLIFLKTLTKWVTNLKRTDAQLEEIINKFNIDNNIIKRLISYNYGFPHIIDYYNKYLNNLYDFNKFDTKTLIKSLTYLMDINFRSNPKLFMYIKSTEFKDDIKNTIKELIKEYLSVTYCIECNKKELNFYYKLFKLGVIKDEDLLFIDKQLNGESTKIKNLSYVNFSEALRIEGSNDVNENSDITEIKTNSITNELNSPIIEFINEIKNEKTNRKECKSCGLYKNQMVVLDTNVENLHENIDIVFVGLNPGKEEAISDKPFVGKSGKYIRKIVDSLPSNTKWLIFNMILCSTNDKNEIIKISGSINQTFKNCSGFFSKIVEKFPTKLFIAIGDDAKSLFNIKSSISDCSGKIFSVAEGVRCIPLIHPSAILRNPKYQAIFDKSAEEILSLFKGEDENPILKVKKDIKQKSVDFNNISHDNIIEDEKDMLFVDTKRIGDNKILMIYTDLAGNKKYQIKDFKYPVCVKNANWDKCDMMTDKIDDVCYVNDYQKTMVLKKCYEILKNFVEI